MALSKPSRLRHQLALRARTRARARLAARYLSGEGIEVGALHLPLRLPSGTRARYLDHATTQELRARNPEVGPDIAEVDVVDDGETLASIPDGSLDFVVANHFIEHCEDPIATIRNQLRVLRPGGRAFMAVPERRRSFDRRRPATSWEHVRGDHEAGPAGSRAGHYAEWMRLVEEVDPAHIEARAAYAAEIGKRIHFHVWGHEDFRAFLEACERELGFPLTVLEVRRNLSEFIVVFERTPAPLPVAN